MIHARGYNSIFYVSPDDPFGALGAHILLYIHFYGWILELNSNSCLEPSPIHGVDLNPIRVLEQSIFQIIVTLVRLVCTVHSAAHFFLYTFVAYFFWNWALVSPFEPKWALLSRKKPQKTYGARFCSGKNLSQFLVSQSEPWWTLVSPSQSFWAPRALLSPWRSYFFLCTSFKSTPRISH